MKLSDSGGFVSDRTNETNLLSNTEMVSKIDEITGKVNHSSANGSLITMTMKNNHLIVETEERSVSIFFVVLISLVF